VTKTHDSSSQDVLRLFNAKAASWPAKYAAGGRLIGRLATLAQEIDSLTVPDDRVLDLGCGSGELARQVAATGRTVVGCDISKEMIRRAAEADPAQNVDWITLPPDWRRLPFCEGTFQVVVASSVLEYLDEPLPLLRECARVLDSVGSLLCTVPDLRHPIRWLEYAAAIVARSPMLRPALLRLPHLASYVSYLELSRQRQTRRSWQSVARCADLEPRAVTLPIRPLRLITLQRIPTGDRCE